MGFGKASPGSRWAVVTGASSGLGREFALALADRGHPVLAVARREERLRTLAEEVGSFGARLEPLDADLSTTVGVEAVIPRAASLDVELLVNNAGLATYGPFASTPVERERDLVRLNVETIVALTQGVLPALLARGQGGVINVASGARVRGPADVSAVLHGVTATRRHQRGVVSGRPKTAVLRCALLRRLLPCTEAAVPSMSIALETMIRRVRT